MTIDMAVQTFDNHQIDIMRRTVAKDISNDKFNLFLQVCQFRGLNSFAREVYAIKRGNQMTIQVSIDGLRLIAERSGKYRGQLGPFFAGPDGQWKDEWLDSKPPTAAKVGILRSDFDQPIWAVARYAAYVQKSPVWERMPDLMTSKCAESLALRKAFPAECAGLYTAEEMSQAADTSAPPAAIVEAKKPALPNAARLNELFSKGKSAGQWANRREMLNRMSLVLHQEITDRNVGELNPELLDLVEMDIEEPATF